jgi:hypothetical protein
VHGGVVAGDEPDPVVGGQGEAVGVLAAGDVDPAGDGEGVRVDDDDLVAGLDRDQEAMTTRPPSETGTGPLLVSTDTTRTPVAVGIVSNRMT